MAADDSQPDATEAVDVRDVVRELSQLLDVREGGTDQVAPSVVDTATDEVHSPDATVALEPVTGPSTGPSDTPSGSGPRADPTMALQAIHLGEHENTGENEMEDEEDETEARAPVARAPRIGVLAWLAEHDLEALFQRGAPRHLDKGAVVATAGAAVARLTVVLEGRLRAVADGKTVDVLVPGDVFGASMVSDGLYSATVDAVEPVRVHEIPLDEVKQWAGEHGAAVHWLHQIVARRARARVLLTARAFAKVPRDRLAAVADECTERPVGDQSGLFEIGDPAGPAYVVLQGRFRVEDAAGETTAPAEGAVLGLSSAASGRARDNSAVAMTDAHVLEVPQGVLRALATPARAPAARPDPPKPTDPPPAPARPERPAPPAPSSAPHLDGPRTDPPTAPSRNLVPKLAEPSAPPESRARLEASDTAWTWLMLSTAGHQMTFVAAIVFAVLGALALPFAAYFMGTFVDAAAQGAQPTSTVAALVATLGVLAFAAVAADLLLARAAGHAEAKLDDVLTGAILRARPRGVFAEQAETLERARLLTRLGPTLVGSTLAGAAQLLAALVLTALVEPRLLVVHAIVLVPWVLAQFLFARRVRVAAENEDRFGQRYDVKRRTLLRARDTLVSTGRAGFVDVLEGLGHRGQAIVNRTGAAATGRAVVFLGAGAAGVAFMLLAGPMVAETTMTVGALVGAGLLLLASAGASAKLYDAAVGRARVSASLVGVHDLLSSEGGAVAPTGDTTSLRGLVRITGLSIAPRAAREAAVRVSELLVRAGEQVAFVGRTGDGQDRVARAIAGVESVDAGEIVLDDTPLAALGGAAAAQRVAFVSRETSVLDASILDNLTLTKTPHLERARAVADAVSLLALVESLPDGFESRLGSGATTLEAVDQLRLSVARALYLDPPVLVVAGAFDDMDAQTASELIEAIHTLRRGRTTLVSTVHATLVTKMDRVVRFDRGAVVPNR